MNSRLRLPTEISVSFESSKGIQDLKKARVDCLPQKNRNVENRLSSFCWNSSYQKNTNKRKKNYPRKPSTWSIAYPPISITGLLGSVISSILRAFQIVTFLFFFAFYYSRISMNWENSVSIFPFFIPEKGKFESFF